MKQTPFHKGELALQEKLGVKEMVHSYAPRVVRPFMPDQHREFYASLPQFFIGSVGSDGLPWASVLFGEPGFVSSPNPTMLTVHSLPAVDDPLSTSLSSGSEVGMVGVEVETRRRNRVNGRIGNICDKGFEILVTQSFGNCPQYIQKREKVGVGVTADSSPPAQRRSQLSSDDISFIEQADTFYIASASSDLGVDEKHGVDMSHRGGAPGFVKVLADGSLLFPDFSGNNHYNTLGNISQNPFAGLLFIDYEAGHILQLSGRAKIVWPDESPFSYDGALNYVQIEPEAVIFRPNALPYIWERTEFSPFLPRGEGWHVKREALNSGVQQYEVVDIVTEAKGVKSVYLSPKSEVSPAYKPGQHLPITLDVDGQKVSRTYTLSGKYREGGALRISVKDQTDGYVSSYINKKLQIGDDIEAWPPAGDFILQSKAKQPSIFISAGVGITPMIAMAEQLIEEGLESATHFIHASRSKADMPFLSELRKWQHQQPNFHLALFFSELNEDDTQPIPGAVQGRLNTERLKGQSLPLDGAYYLCGPQEFMQMVYDWLLQCGVVDSRIFFEAFGPSSLKRVDDQVHSTTETPVLFTKSNKKATWNVAEKTLLEVAEDTGVEAPYSCRSGSCGSCAVNVKKGKVGYEKPPAYPVDNDMALLCCAVPNADNPDESLLLEL